MPIHDAQEQAERLYREILDALEELGQVAQDDVQHGDVVEEDERGPDVGATDFASMMAEEAAERGMNEEVVERVFKSVAAYEKMMRGE